MRLMAEAMDYLNKTTRVAIATFPETVIDLDGEKILDDDKRHKFNKTDILKIYTSSIIERVR